MADKDKLPDVVGVAWIVTNGRLSEVKVGLLAGFQNNLVAQFPCSEFRWGAVRRQGFYDAHSKALSQCEIVKGCM